MLERLPKTAMPVALAALLAALLGACPQPNPPARSSEAPARTGAALFHPDPQHAWNRLYRAVYLRHTADGREYGQDEIDPLLWPDSNHLLEGESREEALRALGDFLARAAESEIRDPAKRAVLQHDLWAVFDWLVARPPEEQEAARPLLTRLARVLRRLALSSKEIEALPDNYAVAAAARAFPAAHDPQQPGRPFLPPDLFADNGPWVALAAFHRSTTPLHVDFVGARSLFLVLLRLPGGRAATLAYQKQLCDEAVRHSAQSRQPPQFPPGTQVALVRRMMVHDTEGRLLPTRLTETVQLRVYRRVRAGQRRSFEEARSDQAFFELEMDRARLFAGQAGGLRPLAPDEHRWMNFGIQHRHVFYDPFRDLVQGSLRKEAPVLSTCAICHAGNGIDSVLSLSGRETYVTTPAEQSAAAASLKEDRYDWGLLRGMWMASDQVQPR